MGVLSSESLFLHRIAKGLVHERGVKNMLPNKSIARSVTKLFQFGIYQNHGFSMLLETINL